MMLIVLIHDNERKGRHFNSKHQKIFALFLAFFLTIGCVAWSNHCYGGGSPVTTPLDFKKRRPSISC